MTSLPDLIATVRRAAGRAAGVDAPADTGPFALLHRAGHDRLDLLTGPVAVAARLADIPLSEPAPTVPDGTRPDGSRAAGPDRSPAARSGPAERGDADPPGGAGTDPPPGPELTRAAALAVVPFRQIAERGFAHVDDGVPLEYLRVTDHRRIGLAEALAALPTAGPALRPGRFDVTDEEYARLVSAVLRDEIARGEGSNVVIHRVYESTASGPALLTALAALRRLLCHERGAYWTFLVHTGGRTLVGASPERHVSVAGGQIMMNPISGTHRWPTGGPDPEALLRFLHDPKEIDELYMVLDEELKMMAGVADGGGRVLGPYLKQMSRLVHTEYLLAGRGGRDVREVLRDTMFAPTVVGGPIESACRMIARHERRGRRYYGGVLALLGHDAQGRQALDAPILIRAAEFTPDGRVRVPVGATVVRHSTPAGEVAETHTKAAAVLAALGLRADPRPAELPEGARPQPSAAGTPPGAAGATTARVAGPAGTAEPGAARRAGGHSDAAEPGPAAARVIDDPRVRAALAARNDRLAPFWLHEQDPAATRVPVLAGRHALVVDAEDAFTAMLAHQLRALGLRVTVRPYTDPGPELVTADLVVPGPGPGDPTDPGSPKMATLRHLVDGLLAAGRPVFAVCLGHQLLAARLGLPVRRRRTPHQGLAREVALWGRVRRLGFYSSFAAYAPPVPAPAVGGRGRAPVAGPPVRRWETPYGPVELTVDPDDGAVHALRGAAFVGLQCHAESVLSRDGLDLLRDLLPPLLRGATGAPVGPDGPPADARVANAGRAVAAAPGA